MADVHSKEIRSKNMAAIKGKNTKPEMLMRKFLHAQGYRYRLHDRGLRITSCSQGSILKSFRQVTLIAGLLLLHILSQYYQLLAI